VIDVASPELEQRMTAVRKVIADLGLADTPELLVFNQIDRLPAEEVDALVEALDEILKS
jgi:GTP-binding protein HflX